MTFHSLANDDPNVRAARWNPSCRWASVAAVAFIVGIGSLRAENSEREAWSGFRRVYVPADRPDVWPTKGEQYLPVDAEQLQQLLKRGRASEGYAAVETTRATDAVFYARYIVNRLIDGRACIEISAASERPALVEWPTSPATIRDPRWRDREQEVVRLGSWGIDEAKVQRIGLVAERSGSLLYRFESPASVQSELQAEFEIVSPPALRRRLFIDLPGDHELFSDDGRVELVQPPVREHEELGGAFLKLDQLGIGYRRWLLSLGPGDSFRVRVKRPSPPARFQANVSSYREALTYSLTPSGFHLTAVLELLGDGEVPETLTIELEPDLYLLNAESERMSLSWQDQPRGPTEPARVLLTIPGKVRDRRSPLLVSAWCRNRGNELHRLPQLALPGLFWSEGTLRIELAEGMDLLDLQSSDLLPRKSPLSGSPMYRAWDFVKLRAQAVPEIAVGKTASNVEASIGTALELSSASTKSVTRLQLRPRGRSIPPRLEVEVSGSWEIDAVESSDSSQFTDWYVDQVDDRRVLRVQLPEPLEAGSPIEVTIEAHAPRSAVLETLMVGELMPIDWRSLDPSRHVLAISVIESLDLSIDGQVRRLNFDDLVEQDWELLQDSDFDVLVLMNETQLSATLQLLPQRPTLEADVQIAVDVQRDAVSHEATIRLAPLRSPASKLRVQLIPAPASEVDWIDPDSGVQLPAVRVSDPQRAAEIGEVWEVQLVSGSIARQSLQAHWTAKLGNGTRVPLVALPDAAKVRATISVVGSHPEELQLVSTGLIQHPLSNVASRSGRRTMATYRYDHAQILRDSAACSVALQPQAAGIAISQPVIVRTNLQSKYSPSHDSIHCAEFVLEGATSLRCQLPDGAKLQRVAWDGLVLDVEVEMGTLRIDVPVEMAARAHSLQIEFSLPQPPLHDGVSLAPPLPDLGLPLSVGKWTLQIPEALDLATPEFLDSIEPGCRGRLAGNWGKGSNDSQSRSVQGATSPPGWNTWAVDFAGTLPNPVQLVDFRRRQSLAYGVGLVAACLTAWQLVGRPHLLGVLLLVAALASVWLPPTSSLFGTACWLGMILGVGWAVLVRQANRTRIAKREIATTMTMPSPVAGLLFAAILLAPCTLSSQEAIAEEMPVAARQIVDVLIPVDEQGAPAGTRHYVPAHFWEDLLRVARQESGDRAFDWVILRGRYQGELRRETPGGEVHASVWTLSWEVETLRRKACVWLPLDRREGNWEANASVDGIPTSIVWDAEGTGCFISIREPGLHRLAVRVEPTTQIDGQKATLRLQLPAVIDAQMKLTIPSEIRGLELPDAAIPTPIDSRRSNITVALPLGERLTLGWNSQGPSATPSATTVSAWQVDQLELLSITPSEAELKLRLLLQGTGSPPTTVKVEVDDALEPLELTATTDAAQRGRIVSIPVTVEEPTGDSGRAVAAASFRLRRDRTFGNYRFPQAEVLELGTRSKTAAVAISDQLSYEAMQSPAGESIEGSAFATLWNDAQRTYAAAHLIQGEQSPWTFSIQPRAGSVAPEESLILVCDLAEVEVRFQSQMESGGLPVVKQTLQIPPELIIKQLEVERSIGREPVRWFRPAPDRVIAFFSEPLDEYFRLSLVGSLRPGHGQDFTFPGVTSRPGENLAQRVQIHRSSECLVEIASPPPGTLDTESRTAGPRGSATYAVAAFTDRIENLIQVSLQTRENRCQYSSQTLTWFDPDLGVSYLALLDVEEGVLDRVVLDAPREWIGPLEISPSAQVGELGEIAPERRQVRIQFAQPVPAGNRVVLRFNGSVAAARDGSWAAPSLSLADARTSEQFLAIPGESPSASRWSTEGVLDASPLPAIVHEADLPVGARVYRVQPARRRDFTIRRLPDSPENALASLALADVRVREDSRGALVQVTQFFLPPIHRRELILEWPAGCDPIGVYLENRLLPATPIDAMHWRLQIGPSDLPIVIAAVSRSGGGERLASRQFRRPRLWQGTTEYEFPTTLWSIESPRSASPPSPAAETAETVAEHCTLRLARLTQLLAIAEPRLVELSDEDRRAWKQIWVGRLQSDCARLEDAGVPAPELSSQVDEDAVTLQARRELIAQATQLTGRMAELDGENVVTDASPAESLRLDRVFPAGGSDFQATCYSVGDAIADLELPPLQSAGVADFTKVILTVIFVAALGALLRWAPDFDVAGTLAAHPRWLVVMLGGIWWAFLAPSSIGIALVAVAMLSWAAERWQRDAFVSATRNS